MGAFWSRTATCRAWWRATPRTTSATVVSTPRSRVCSTRSWVPSKRARVSTTTLPLSSFLPLYPASLLFSSRRFLGALFFLNLTYLLRATTVQTDSRHCFRGGSFHKTVALHS